MRIRHLWPMAIGNTFLLLGFSVLPQAARADSFDLFTVSGTFLNDPFVTLSGGFIVNETNGTVVSVDLFHGSTELSILSASGPLGQFAPDAFAIIATDSADDLLSLYFPANTGASLIGYGGGPLCSDLEVGCGGILSNFNAHDHGFETSDDLKIGSITDAGPVSPPVPEPGPLGLTGIALAAVGFYKRAYRS